MVAPKPGQAIVPPRLVQMLKDQKTAEPYIPERLIVREALPATPSGKIQKFKLREQLRDASR